MTGNRLLALKALGQHVWLDNLSRSLLREGSLQHMINEEGIDGVTSNPVIFEKAISASHYYRDDLQSLRSKGLSAEACYEALVVPDIRAASAMLHPAYVASHGEAGYVSLEVSPVLANDTAATIAAAYRLQQAVGRANVLIKVPGTPAGIAAFEQLTAAGIRINVTLIFSLAQYQAVALAWLRGARTWLGSGGDPAQLRSVASIFLSRVDSQVDQRLSALGTPAAREHLGQAGLALAKACYGCYREIFHGPDFAALQLAGVRPQTLLWASTGTKNPAYSDVHYVEALIGPETTTTLPDATLAAFRDHGQAEPRLTEGMAEAAQHIKTLAALGIDLGEIGEALQLDGVRLFAEAYQKIMQTLACDGDDQLP